MSVFVIPSADPTDPSDTFWTQETTLEGVVYALTFTYSQRENCFYLSIADASVTDGSYLVSSIKLITNKRLISRYAGITEPWPPGELIAVSSTSDDSIAGLGDLGSRVNLVYITSDDPGFVP